MRFRTTAAAALLGLLAGACASVPTPIPVVGSDVAIGRLAGEWGGEYWGDTSGRSGSIVFQLAADADTAYGDVVMISHERRESHIPVQDPAAGLPIARAAAVLSISFVRASGGGLIGRLAPYRDPDCGCVLDTRFEGELRGDTIEGTFVSQPVGGGDTQTGTWKVRNNFV